MDYSLRIGIAAFNTMQKAQKSRHGNASTPEIVTVASVRAHAVIFDCVLGMAVQLESQALFRSLRVRFWPFRTQIRLWPGAYRRRTVLSDTMSAETGSIFNCVLEMAVQID